MESKQRDIFWVDPNELKPNPRNNNRHSPEQIERIAKIMRYQGFRKGSPITVSNQSGYIVTGHARREAALLNGFKKVPVVYDDFQDADQEYAHMTADNESARWAQLDWQSFKMETKNMTLDPDFFGLENYDGSEKEKSDKEKEAMFLIECEFADSQELEEVYNELLEKGVMVKVKHNG